MKPFLRGAGLAVAFVSAFAIVAAPSAEAQSGSTPVAYVYIQIQGPEGAVYGFRANASGQLSTIAGAPWKPAGQLIGDNKKMMITLGQTNLHSYAIESSGAIGVALESNPDTDFGSECDAGTNVGAVLDHTGQYVYVLQQKTATDPCMAYKSFEINNQFSEGAFDGVGETEADPAPGGGDGLPSILGNESFAYADQYDGPVNSILGFQRNSSGALQGIGVMDPTFPGSAAYTPHRPDASPAGNYVVLEEYQNTSNTVQAASFSVDGAGNLSSTNTPATMPVSPFFPTGSTFSPSGNLFVTWADNGLGNPSLGDGIQIYNFNGAAPLTYNTSLLSGMTIDQVAWDKSNHLYAISTANNLFYVFTVTPTSATQDAMWTIGAPFKMLVVSQ
jgi:hypothetical protein